MVLAIPSYDSDSQILCDDPRLCYCETGLGDRHDGPRGVGFCCGEGIVLLLPGRRLLDLSIGTTRNRERKRCTGAFVPDCPKAALVLLQYGSADGEPDSHAVTLRRIEGFE